MAEEPKKSIQGLGLGEVLGVTSSKDNVGEVLLADGTIVRYKSVVLEAFRSEEYNEDGDPRYALKITHVIVSMEIPVDLKREKKQ